MPENVDSLVRRIRARAQALASFKIRFSLSSRLEMFPMDVEGRTWFLAPDRFRSECASNGTDIVTIRVGNSVRRYLPARHEVWLFDLLFMPTLEPLNHSLSDLRDPFAACNPASIELVGEDRSSTGATYGFRALSRMVSGAVELDTRKGFSVRYVPRGVDLRIRLRVDAERGLAREMDASTTEGKELFSVRYDIEKLNTSIAPSLFALDDTDPTLRRIDWGEVVRLSLDPGVADSASSVN